MFTINGEKTYITKIKDPQYVDGLVNLSSIKEKFLILHSQQKYLFFLIYTLMQTFQVFELEKVIILLLILIVIFNMLSLYFLKREKIKRVYVHAKVEMESILTKRINGWFITFVLVSVVALRARVTFYEAQAVKPFYLYSNYFGLLLLSIFCVVNIIECSRLKRMTRERK